MATYKDDLDILKAAEKADTNKLTFNAITELDNKGLLGRYGGESEEEESGGIDLGITGASVGEYAKIKTVDANGVPTEWESGSEEGGGGIDLGITGASAGEYAKIKTVDADGVPTAWESGAGGGGVLVATATIDEQAMTITLDKTYNDIIASPFTVAIFNDVSSSNTSFVIGTSESNVTFAVYMAQITPEGSIDVVLFEAQSPDAPLVCDMS